MKLPIQSLPVIRNRFVQFSSSKQRISASMTGIIPSQCACQPTQNGNCIPISNNCPIDPRTGQQFPSSCTNLGIGVCGCQCGAVSEPLTPVDTTIGVRLP